MGEIDTDDKTKIEEDEDYTSGEWRAKRKKAEPGSGKRKRASFRKGSDTGSMLTVGKHRIQVNDVIDLSEVKRVPLDSKKSLVTSLLETLGAEGLGSARACV